jgi:hypothetical protein
MSINCFKFDSTEFTFDSTPQKWDQTICPAPIIIFDGHDGKPFKEKKPKWQHDKEHNDKRRATIAESIYGKPVVVAKKIAPLAEIQTTDDDEESVLMLML